MRPDTTSRDEQGAREYEAIRGRDEWIDNRPTAEAGEGRVARPLGPDPWLPFTCPRCGDEDLTGMPKNCTCCGWENY